MPDGGTHVHERVRLRHDGSGLQLADDALQRAAQQALDLTLALALGGRQALLVEGLVQTGNEHGEQRLDGGELVGRRGGDHEVDRLVGRGYQVSGALLALR